jgi:DNA-binding NarL/FixJ family response regulator
MTRIALIDDHRLFASGLAALLGVLGTVRAFDTAEAALDALEAEPADLVLLDFYIPGVNAAEIIAALRDRCGVTRVIVLSASLSPADRAASLRAGALAFLTKHAEPDVLLRACEQALRPGDIAEVRHSEAQGSEARAAVALGLTGRQLDVLTMLSHGYGNREIADLLEISPETVKSHVKAIFDRLQVSTRTEAVAAARSNGLF